MTKLIRANNMLIWLVLIFGCGLITLSQVILDNNKAALVMAFASVTVWIAWFIYSRWLFGLRRHVTRFMRMPVDQLTFVDKQLSANRLADVVRALHQYCETSQSQSFATAANMDFKQLRFTNSSIEPLVWRTIDIDGGNLVNIPENAVFLLEVNGNRVAIKPTFESHHFIGEEQFSNTPVNRIQLCASSIEQANAMMQWVLNESSIASIYRGQVLHVHHSSSGKASNFVQIVDRPNSTRDSVVLPEEVLSLTEKLLLGRAKHQQRLAGLGHSSRLGLLFYGPPGTGKTLVTKWILSQIPDHTVIVPTDLAPETLRECFRLAAYLQPTVVVIEDVDLLAVDRTLSSGRLDGLQELMNEMDGLSSTSDTMVILSTNRPEVLEPALASRPGRVSQAIEFPLPDQPSRTRLLKLFLGATAAGASSEMLDLDRWAQKTDQASPAFLQELCKRAILLACDRTTQSDIEVTDNDLREAMHQLIVTGGSLNANVLGFPTAVATSV